MISFNGMDYSSLFGYGLSGMGNPIYSSLSQVSGINPSSFSKILRSQYDRTAQNSVPVNNGKYGYYGNNTARYGGNTLSQISTESSKLVASAKKLVSEGSENLFQSGDTYDPDKAYVAVNDFINSYNDTISAISQTGKLSVQNAGSSLTRMTGIMKKSLSMVGVNVSKEGTLSIDEETFKKADMDTVKSLFGSNKSYAKIISSSAERIRSSAVAEQSFNINKLYGMNGSFYSSLYSGYGFNSFF